MALFVHINITLALVVHVRSSAGLRSRIDVGVVNEENGEYHYFANVADIHL